MFLFYNNDEPVDWVIGQIDVAEERLVFGTQVETSGLSWFPLEKRGRRIADDRRCLFKWIRKIGSSALKVLLMSAVARRSVCCVQVLNEWETP